VFQHTELEYCPCRWQLQHLVLLVEVLMTVDHLT
jgi:hypothetical protein